MTSFSPLMGAVLVMVVSNMAFSASQRVFLSSDNPTPCYNNTVDLICYYPDVMERVNGQPRYIVTTASWTVNGELLFPDEDVFDQQIVNQTASRLRVRIDPAIFTGDPVSFTCYLPLRSGGEDNASTVVDPQDTAAPPTFTDTVVIGTSVTVSWDHSNKGPCFNHLTFSYNITWYPVVGRVPQRGEGQSGVTGPGATEYIIPNLMNDTDYQAELVGFTPIYPPVFSSVATVGFTTKVPPTDESPSEGGSGDNTATIVGSVTAVLVVVVVSVIVAVTLTMTVCFWQRERPRESASRRTDEKQKESREHAAGASVQVGSGEDTMLVASPFEEPAPATGHQEQRGTEYPSDQWQTHYVEIDKKWLNDVSVNHIENEMFTVQYAVVDREAMASGVPQPEVVKVTSVEALVRGVQLTDSFMDGTRKENPILALTPTTEALEEECLKLEDSELVLGTVKISQPSGLPVLSCGWCVEETSADSADALSVVNCKLDTAPQGENTAPLEEHSTPLEKDNAPLEEGTTSVEETMTLQDNDAPLQEDDTTPQEEDVPQQESNPSCDEECEKLEPIHGSEEDDGMLLPFARLCRKTGCIMEYYQAAC